MEKSSNIKNLQSPLTDKNTKIVSNNIPTAPFFMYSKQVSGDNFEVEEINDNNKKEQLLEVLDSFYSPKNYKKLDDINLKRNCKKWVKLLFSEYPDMDHDNMEYLLNDFTDSMNTNMREKEMYAVSILAENRLILCHSRMGEKSINPNWTVFVRMLDKDNINRYVSFEYVNGDVKVRHYEKNKSKFFTKWLGISEKDAFYAYGGENKFYSKIDGFPVSLEIRDEDFDNLEIKNKSIVLKSDIVALNITHIMRGKKRYNNIKDFAKDCTARKFDLAYYTEEYERLNTSLTPYFQKIFDDESGVSTPSKNLLKKENDKIQILFCNEENIEIKDSYLESFKIALLNNEKIKVFHAGMDLNENPLKIKNFDLYNDPNTTLAKPLIEYFNEKDCSKSFSIDLEYVIFNLLAKDNKDKPIFRFFKELSYKIAEELDFSSTISEDSVIELKSKDFLKPKDKDIITILGEDIAKKIKESDYKLYIIGYDETIKKYEPFTDRFDDSRLDHLNKELRKFTKINNLHLFKVKYNQNQCILFLTVKKS